MKRARYRNNEDGRTDQLCAPCGKISYASRKRAQQVSRQLKLRHYQCPEGNGFHLGHRTGSPTVTKGLVTMNREHRPTAPFKGSMEELEELARKLREGNCQ